MKKFLVNANSKLSFICNEKSSFKNNYIYKNINRYKHYIYFSNNVFIYLTLINFTHFINIRRFLFILRNYWNNIFNAIFNTYFFIFTAIICFLKNKRKTFGNCIFNLLCYFSKIIFNVKTSLMKWWWSFNYFIYNLIYTIKYHQIDVS